MSIEDIVLKLEIQRDNVEKAITILRRPNGRSKNGRGRLSAAARSRISEAQKKRWAEQKKRKAAA